LGRVDQIIGIEPERVIPGSPRQSGISRRREIVDPYEIKHPRPELAGDLPRAVFRPGIHDHDLVEQPID